MTAPFLFERNFQRLKKASPVRKVRKKKKEKDSKNERM
jgi:hypothetical protein